MSLFFFIWVRRKVVPIHIKQKEFIMYSAKPNGETRSNHRELKKAKVKKLNVNPSWLEDMEAIQKKERQVCEHLVTC